MSTRGLVLPLKEELKAPRKPDGSLPDVNFMKLASGSKLIDAGVDLENYIASDLRTAGIESLPFKGKFPDLGYAERD